MGRGDDPLEAEDGALGIPNTADPSQWVSVREAGRMADYSVPGIYKAAYEGRLKWTTVTVGRVRREMRIWRPSLERLIANQKKVETEQVKDRGRQEEPALT